MPLSFVIFGAVSAIATSYVDHSYDGIAWLLLLCNVLILIFGLYLGATHKEEPYWVTLSSIIIGVASVLFYGVIKYQWVDRQKATNQVIFPQLY